MITKSCEDLGIPVFPSRHTYSLNQWLEQRTESFYPEQEGYDEKAKPSSSLQYPLTNPVNLPDALKGDKKDKWALLSLSADQLQEMNEWDIGFKEAFPLNLADLSPDTIIPGLIIFSSRALPLAAWMSGLELGYLRFRSRNFSSYLFGNRC